MKNVPSKRVRALMVAMACLLPLQQARAGIVATEATAADVERVQRFVSREDVARELVALGVDAQTASERVAALSAQELSSIAGKLDSLPVGAALSNNELILVLVLLLVLVIVL